MSDRSLDQRACLRAALAPYLARGCEWCGSHEQLTWHHRDPATKTATVADLVSQGRSFTRVWREVKKCVLLCWRCHVRVHADAGRLHGRLGELVSAEVRAALEEGAGG